MCACVCVCVCVCACVCACVCVCECVCVSPDRRSFLSTLHRLLALFLPGLHGASGLADSLPFTFAPGPPPSKSVPASFQDIPASEPAAALQHSLLPQNRLDYIFLRCLDQHPKACTTPRCTCAAPRSNLRLNFVKLVCTYQQSCFQLGWQS